MKTPPYPSLKDNNMTILSRWGFFSCSLCFSFFLSFSSSLSPNPFPTSPTSPYSPFPPAPSPAPAPSAQPAHGSPPAAPPASDPDISSHTLGAAPAASPALAPAPDPSLSSLLLLTGWGLPLLPLHPTCTDASSPPLPCCPPTYQVCCAPAPSFAAPFLRLLLLLLLSRYVMESVCEAMFITDLTIVTSSDSLR